MTTNLNFLGSTPAKGQSVLSAAEPAVSAAGSSTGDAAAPSLFFPMFMQMLFGQHFSAPNSPSAMGAVAIPIEQLEIVDPIAEGMELESTPPACLNELTQLSVGMTHAPVTMLQTELTMRNAQLQVKDPGADVVAAYNAEAMTDAAVERPQGTEISVKQGAGNLYGGAVLETDLKQHPVIRDGAASAEEKASPEKPAVLPDHRKPVPFSSPESIDRGSMIAAVKAAGTILSPSVEAKAPTADDRHVTVDPVVPSIQKPQREKTEKISDKKNGKPGVVSEREVPLKEMMNDADEYTVVQPPQTSGGKSEDDTQQPFRQPAESANVPAAKSEVIRTANPAEEINPISFKASVETKPVTHTAAAASPALKPETVQSVLEQLTKGVSVALDEHRSEMKLILHPESLGEVKVRVQVEEGKVSTTMDVQHAHVKNAIETNIPQLREALSLKGLTMERIEITTTQNSLADGTARNHQSHDRHKSHRPLQLDEDENDAVKMLGYNTVEYII